MRELVRRSDVPGRARWFAPTLHHHARLCAVVEDAISTTAGVRTAQVNPSTGSLLVRYDAGLTNVTEIEAVALDALRLPPLDAEAWRAHLANPRHDATCDHGGHHHHDHAHGGHSHDGEEGDEGVGNLYLGGVALGGLLLKRVIVGSIAVVGQPWLTGLIAICTLVTGVPFLKGAWRTLTERHQLTTDTLVSSATVASIFLGESITALTVIWLLNLGEYSAITRASPDAASDTGLARAGGKGRLVGRGRHRGQCSRGPGSPRPSDRRPRGDAHSR